SVRGHIERCHRRSGKTAHIRACQQDKARRRACFERRRESHSRNAFRVPARKRRPAHLVASHSLLGLHPRIRFYSALRAKSYIDSRNIASRRWPRKIDETIEPFHSTA